MRWMLSVLLGACGALDDAATDAGATGVASLAECSTEAIEQKVARNEFQLWFSACGRNEFLDFAWSTDGHKLYYQMGMVSKVHDVDLKREVVVPTPNPIGAVAWVSATRLVVPVGPNPEVESGPQRLGVFDVTKPAEVAWVDLPADLRDPKDLSRTRDPEKVYLTAVRGDGPRRIWEVSLADGAAVPAFDFAGTVDTFTFTPAADAVVVGHEGTVTLYDAAAGKVKGAWAPATRGVVHPKGRWLMLEHDGPLVDAITGDPAAQEDGARTTHRPMLSFADTQTGGRWLVTSMHGSKFEWWELKDFYGGFVLWGFDGRPYRRNVMLGDFFKRFTGAEIGELPYGVEAFGAEQGATFTQGG